MLAGGDWKFIGNRQEIDPSDGRMKPFLGHPIHLCAGPPGYFCIMDNERSFVRCCNMDATYIKCTLNADQAINRAGLFGQVGGIACSKGVR